MNTSRKIILLYLYIAGWPKKYILGRYIIDILLFVFLLPYSPKMANNIWIVIEKKTR